MAEPLRVYIGWDQRDAESFDVCRRSLVDKASIPVQPLPLKDWELRAMGVYWRPYHVDERGQMWDQRDGRPFSTNFSYTRFCVPMIENYGDEPVVFCDADMLWRADVADLLPLLGDRGLACVQHDYRPDEREKMTGNIQTVYPRRHWSSPTAMRPCPSAALTSYAVHNMNHDWLHGMAWFLDADMAALPEEWNWLEGWSDPQIDPKVVHFTRGTPDMAGHEDATFAEEWWRAAGGRDLIPITKRTAA